MQLLSVTQVCERRNCKRTKLYCDIQSGIFPPAIKSGKGSAWPEHEVNAVLVVTAGGATEAELRELVAGLVELRKQDATNVLQAVRNARRTAGGNSYSTLGIFPPPAEAA